MKRLLLYTMVLLFASCQKDAGLTYSDKAGIYFVYDQKFKVNNVINRVVEFDKVIYSFGMVDDSKKEDTAKIAVLVMGNAADHDRVYRVSINSDSTTAVEGIHYKMIQPLQKFKSGKLVDTLRIVVLRENLSSSHIEQENKRIALKIEQSEDFNVGIAKGAQMNLVINNYLSEPKWWIKYVGRGLYYYHPEKWKILVKFNKAFENRDADEPIDYELIPSYINSLRSYLANIPTYDKITGERVLIDRLVK